MTPAHTIVLPHQRCQDLLFPDVFLFEMAEARRLKSGKWRIYLGDDRALVRDPSSGSILTFVSLKDAKDWWSEVHPAAPSLQEAHKCARCGAYFSANTPWTVYGGRPYHLAHIPKRELDELTS